MLLRNDGVTGVKLWMEPWRRLFRWNTVFCRIDETFFWRQKTIRQFLEVAVEMWSLRNFVLREICCYNNNHV